MQQDNPNSLVCTFQLAKPKTKPKILKVACLASSINVFIWTRIALGTLLGGVIGSRVGLITLPLAIKVNNSDKLKMLDDQCYQIVD